MTPARGWTSAELPIVGYTDPHYWSVADVVTLYPQHTARRLRALIIEHGLLAAGRRFNGRSHRYVRVYRATELAALLESAP